MNCPKICRADHRRMTALVSREIQMIGRERFIELNAIRVKSILLLVSGTTVKADTSFYKNVGAHTEIRITKNTKNRKSYNTTVSVETTTFD